MTRAVFVLTTLQTDLLNSAISLGDARKTWLVTAVQTGLIFLLREDVPALFRLVLTCLRAAVPVRGLAIIERGPGPFFTEKTLKKRQV